MELTATPVPGDDVALLVIDMQNGFCHPEGSFAQVGLDVSGCGEAIPGCVALVEAARGRGVPVIFTRAIHEPGLIEWNILTELPLLAPLRELGSCVEGTWDAEFVDELRVEPGDVVLTKSRYSPFYETDLLARLSRLGVVDLVVCGVTTSCCVESTVRDASQRSLRTHVVQDATGDTSADAHTAAFQTMGSMFGWTTTCAEVGRSWGAA
jgi:ureidoacrylate peracid hydrolase